jgi:hypothetical protein
MAARTTGMVPSSGADALDAPVDTLEPGTTGATTDAGRGPAPPHSTADAPRGTADMAARTTDTTPSSEADALDAVADTLEPGTTGATTAGGRGLPPPANTAAPPGADMAAAGTTTTQSSLVAELDAHAATRALGTTGAERDAGRGPHPPADTAAALGALADTAGPITDTPQSSEADALDVLADTPEPGTTGATTAGGRGLAPPHSTADVRRGPADMAARTTGTVPSSGADALDAPADTLEPGTTGATTDAGRGLAPPHSTADVRRGTADVADTDPPGPLAVAADTLA